MAAFLRTRDTLFQGISSVNCPGTETVTTPPHMHMHICVLSSAGLLPISTVGAPVTQGDVVAGMHGIGVSTPEAAEVADATVGLDGVMHIPNGRTFTIGT